MRHSGLTILWLFQGNSEGTQLYTYMYSFSPKHPFILHKKLRQNIGCAPCAAENVLVSHLFCTHCLFLSVLVPILPLSLLINTSLLAFWIRSQGTLESWPAVTTQVSTSLTVSFLICKMSNSNAVGSWDLFVVMGKVLIHLRSQMHLSVQLYVYLWFPLWLL